MGARESTLFRDVALVCLADGLVGVSFGATTVAGHLAWWVPIAMSLLVFAGGSQFAAVGVVLAGGSPFAAVAAGAVLNTRLLPYGFAVADVVGPPERTVPDRAVPVRARSARWRWLIRLLGAQVITDESTAFALRQTDPARRRAAFWTCGLTLFAVWNVSVLLGVLAGSVVRNTDAFGLDAMFPAALARAHAYAASVALTPTQARRHGLALNQDGRRRSGFELLSHPKIGVQELARIWPEFHAIAPKIAQQLEIDAKYAVYLDRQAADIVAFRRDEGLELPDAIDYAQLGGLSNEIKQKLQAVRPRTVGQAGRIDGMTPVALSLLLAHIRRNRRDLKSVGGSV